MQGPRIDTHSQTGGCRGGAPQRPSKHVGFGSQDAFCSCVWIFFWRWRDVSHHFYSGVVFDKVRNIKRSSGRSFDSSLSKENKISVNDTATNKRSLGMRRGVVIIRL